MLEQFIFTIIMIWFTLGVSCIVFMDLDVSRFSKKWLFMFEAWLFKLLILLVILLKK